MEFHLLSQDDDMSFLSKAKNKSIYESLKWIDLRNENSLSFGGGYRFQVESFLNENFVKQRNQDNIRYFNRVLLHSSLNLGDRFELYVELNSSTVIDKTDISPVDKDELSVNQAFIEYNFNELWSFLFGRENLKFGSRRLIDIREGPNVRRSFDLLRFDYKNDFTNVTTFFSIPVKPKPKLFDNEYLKFHELFTGIYATKKVSKTLNFDFYGFYQKDDDVTYSIGYANERRYSLGTRFFGTLNKFTFNNEAVYQFGKFGELGINAYTISLQGEYENNHIGDKTVFGLKTELISGDKSQKDTHLNTFDPLYPRGAYFGRVAKFGPANLIDIHPYININKSAWYIEIDYDIFWRYSINDGVYNAAIQIEYPSTNDDAFIGHQFGTLFGYNANNHLNMELETNLIIPGEFLKNSNLTSNLFHVVVTTEFKF
tara:strand:- start:9510 stop:10793 length:1284 start_codon:yes stop_codon:yes gene_type:complete